MYTLSLHCSSPLKVLSNRFFKSGSVWKTDKGDNNWSETNLSSFFDTDLSKRIEESNITFMKLGSRSRLLATSSVELWKINELGILIPPDRRTLRRWQKTEVALAMDGCKVEFDGKCEHGHESWLVFLGLV
jgi:hypothetical protein